MIVPRKYRIEFLIRASEDVMILNIGNHQVSVSVLSDADAVWSWW